MLRIFLCGCCVLAFAVWNFAEEPTSGTEKPARSLRAQIRRPIGLVIEGEHLYVANRQSGGISVIERSTGEVLSEHEIAGRIAEMVSLPGSESLLVLDDQKPAIWKVEWEDRKASVQLLAELPFAGNKLALDETGRKILISAKWAHRVIVLQLDQDFERLVETESVTLPFAPLELLLLPQEQRLLVAEAFGNRLAVLDGDAKLLKVHAIEGHNIRDLELSRDGKSVLIAQQQIPDKAVASYDGVHWGRIVTNAVQVLEVSKLLDTETSKPLAGWLNAFGDVGSATADASEVLTGDNNLVAVAFTGVGEVAVRYKNATRRIAVGNGPEALATDGETLYVANRLDDTISVIELATGKVTKTISLGPMPALTAEERGERLFFDARLSHDGWLSCHSCHSEGHTAGLVVDTLGDGDYGAPKLVPSLLGTRDTQPWGWDGRMELLHQQIQQSFTTTMHGEPLSTRELEDIFAFLTSLNAPPALGDAPKEMIAQGKKVFEAQGCVNCHAAPAYTTPVTVEVDLVDEQGRRRFNPPSLRGVGHRRRFFHDGRAKSLEDVVQKVRHQLDEPLSPKDAGVLLDFLRSL